MDKLMYFCCICMQKSKILVNLSSVDVDNIEYITKLDLCVPKQTWRNSHQICVSCVSQLSVAHAFVLCCLDSEKFRQEELDKNKNLDKTLTKIEDNDEDKSDVKKETVFTCDNCNKSFRQKKYLSQHITKLHINRRKRESNKKTTKKRKDENETEELPRPESSSVLCVNPDTEDITLKDEFVKEENVLQNTESLLDNDAESKVIKTDPSDNEDFEETTDAGNDDTENYENYSGESEVDQDLDTHDQRFGKKRGPKKAPQKCSFCDELFQKRHEWAKHIRTKHTFQKPFWCDLCDAKYMNGYSLLIHKRKHTNEKPFICSTCGKSFVSSADLNHHNKIHDVDRAYPCPMCDRSFKTHSNLRTHRLQMHLDPADWKFPCHLCEKKFPIRGNLVKHLKRHAGIKEFSCHICDKRFVNKAELTLHLNTHTNQRLFKCKLCWKDYKNREGLRRHMKVVHDQGNWKAPKSEKKHLCPMCPKIFAFGNKLQRHIFTHTGEKPFKCEYCQKRFIDNYGRKVHYKKDHNIVDVCGL